MVLILSDQADSSVDFVVASLKQQGQAYFRLNVEDVLEKKFRIVIKGDAIQLFFEEQQLDLDAIGAVWFRKFGLKNTLYREQVARELPYDDASFLFAEFYTLTDTLVYALKDKKWLTHPYRKPYRKPGVLLEAAKSGLKIPESIITNSLENINRDDLIVKSLQDAHFMERGNVQYSMFTKRLKKENLPPLFHASLLQKEIRKKFELRVFYILGTCYTAAIMSQLSESTKLDFRKVDINKPVKYVPFNLPESIAKKLDLLMQSLELNCGSIDLMVDENDDYYFLEVNPTGQFGMISYPCNFGLFKIVANALIQLNHAYFSGDIKQRRAETFFP